MKYSNELLNLEQTILYIGRGEKFVRKLIKKDLLEFYKIGTKYVFSKDYIDNWIKGVYID